MITNIDDLDIDKISKKELRKVVTDLLELTRRLPSEQSQKLIDKLIAKCEQLNDKESLVIIYYVKHIFIFGLLRKNGEIQELAEKMNSISEEIDFQEGIALYNMVLWGLEKLQGNIEGAITLRNMSMELMNSLEKPNLTILNWIKYSFAVGEWTEEKKPASVDILEDCMIYFRKREHYSSEIQAATIIADIYSKTNQNDKLVNIVQEIMGDDNLFQYYPKEVLGRFHFYLGLMFLTKADIELAEMHLFSSTQLFKRFGLRSNYIYDYLLGLSILARIYATTGQLVKVHEILSELKAIVDEGDLSERISKQFVNSLLSSITITQFYVTFHRRENHSEDFQDQLKYLLLKYQQFLLLPEMLTELMVYSGIEIDELNELKKERVSSEFLKKVINFLIELQNPKESNTEKRIKNASKILNLSNENSVRDGFGRIFGDLILAKLYLSIGKYEEFKNVMKRYIFKTERITHISLQFLAQSMEIIYKFLQGDKAEKAIDKLTNIITQCENRGMKRVCNEVKALRQMLIQKNMNIYHKQIFSSISYQDIVLTKIENKQ
ncbi:MAG: hypothetical protein KGD64_14520 [Candidatus Heimdallarchaeota archaeon]|nr:hypothetical protein [Candidatus Heimdallarchaeota archaeon]